MHPQRTRVEPVELSILRWFTIPPKPPTYQKAVVWGLHTGLTCASSIGLFLIFTGWLSVSDWKIASFSFVGVLAGGAALFFWLLLGCAGLVCLFIPIARVSGFGLLVQSIAVVLAVYCVAQIRWDVRRNAFESLAQRSAPLISAIEAYQQTHATPPQALQDLVPEFLAAVPRTGMAVNAEFQYVPKHTARPVWPEFKEEPWLLYVWAGELGFDYFVYVPSRVYPERGGWGFYERIGDWAYCHE